MCIRDSFYIVDGSFLEEYDEFNIGVQFKAAATVSITYACLLYTSEDPTAEKLAIKNRHTEEVEAESISYAVCKYFGLSLIHIWH